MATDSTRTFSTIRSVILMMRDMLKAKLFLRTRARRNPRPRVDASVRPNLRPVQAASRCRTLVALAVLLSLATTARCFAQDDIKENRAIRARLLLENHLVDSASKMVDSALLQDSLDADLWLARAMVSGARSDRVSQVAALRRALAIHPEFLQCHQILAEVYCDSGLTDSADRYIALPLKLDSLNPRVVYYSGRICEQRAQLDSAIMRYGRAWGMLSADDLLRVPVCPGYTIQTSRLRTTGPGIIPLSAGRPTLILFWASWSPSSIKAFKSIVAQLPKAGISWRFLPVNVDESNWRKSTRQRVEAKARELGFKDPVAVDSALNFYNLLHLVSVPTLIATNISGEIEQIESGWSPLIDARVTKSFFAAGDSLSRSSPHAQTDCERSMRRLGTAWQEWESADPMGAWGLLTRAIRACSTSAYPRVLSTVWRWQGGDSLRAGRDAYDALRADSTDPWSWLVVAEVERHRGHLDSATRIAQRALRLDSSLTAAWVLTGRVAEAIGDTLALQRAISALDRLNRLDPGLSVLHAYLLRNSGQFAQAIAIWRALLDPRI